MLSQSEFESLLKRELSRPVKSIKGLVDIYGGEEASFYGYFVDHFKDEGCNPAQVDIACDKVQEFFRPQFGWWYATEKPQFSKELALDLLEKQKMWFDLVGVELTEEDGEMAVAKYKDGGCTPMGAVNAVLEGIRQCLDDGLNDD